MLPTIAAHAKMHDLSPKKSLGQNFLFDYSLCDKIVRYAFSDNSMKGKNDYTSRSNGFRLVLEIGPGTGGLTRALLEHDDVFLIAIEQDARCISLLDDIKSYYQQKDDNYSSLHIINNDALKIKMQDILMIYQNNKSATYRTSQNDIENSKTDSFSIRKIQIVSNLPYNISTTLLIQWLHQIEHIDKITIMVQKEVAERICATFDQKNIKSYGRLSIITQALCDVSYCFDVSPKAFYPAPKVWSSIIQIVPKQHLICKKVLYMLEKLTMHAFSQRRKMLRSSLSNFFDSILSEHNEHKDVIDRIKIWDLIKIDPTLRAENISVNQYVYASKILAKHFS